MDLVVWGIDLEGVFLVLNDDILSDLEYFVYWVGWMGWVNMVGIVIILYVFVEDVLIEKLEEWGIIFILKDLKNGWIVMIYDWNCCKVYCCKKVVLDLIVKGFVKKVKKKVKLGYKCCIK